MQHTKKHIKATIIVACALVALSVAAPGLASNASGGGGDRFCEDLREACEDANGTALLCVETPTHLAECSGATDDDFERACRHYDASCRLVEVTQLVVACACL
ncbi:hypothetical protein LZC95_17420 [Pendulispora brunnea]|uniref:Uncharacterized protein n=1 Tax=Pendulispora brunnea TaxID=2905690 RepID=A0ABZ2KKK7_9BACT